MAPATCAVCQSRRASQTASAAIAVCACVPLMSVMPSFGPSVIGARPWRRSTSVAAPLPDPVVQLAFADHRQPEMRERCEIATRTDASLLRNRRPQPGVEHPDEQLRQAAASRPSSPLRARSRGAASSRALPHASRCGTDARRMAAHEIHLQLGESLRRNGHLGELSESGRHAVHDLAITHDAIDVLVRSEHAGSRLVRERDTRRSPRATASTSAIVSDRPSSTTEFIHAGMSGHGRRSKQVAVSCLTGTRRAFARSCAGRS